MIIFRKSILLMNSLTKSLQLEAFKNASRTNVSLRVASSSIHLTFHRKYSSQNETRGLVQIYNGPLAKQIRTVKFFSLTTSLIGIIGQPFIYTQVTEMGGFPLVVVACTFVGFFTFATPFLLHYITKKYITDIKYDPGSKKYIATTISFFCGLNELEFTAADVKVPDVPGMFTSFYIKDTPVFVDPKEFSDPSHYGIMMGFDKPLDFKLKKNISK